MKYLLILIPLFFSCFNEPPTNKTFSEMDKFEIENIKRGKWPSYSESDRLSLMKSPVTIVSKGEVSHGVFREKYKTYNIVIKDGDNQFYTFYGTEWESTEVGDIIK